MIEQKTKWDDFFKAGRDYNPMNQILLDLVLDTINVSGRVAIDLGCGTGDAVIKLAKRGFMVTGLDWSQDALSKAEARSKEAGVTDSVVFKQADLNNLSPVSLADKSADVVLCKLVIAFISDKKFFLKTAKSLLTDKGALILQTPVLHDAVEYSPEDKPGIAVKYEEFRSLLSEVFDSVNEFNHSYHADKGDLVTFIVK